MGRSSGNALSDRLMQLLPKLAAAEPAAVTANGPVRWLAARLQLNDQDNRACAKVVFMLNQLEKEGVVTLNRGQDGQIDEVHLTEPGGSSVTEPSLRSAPKLRAWATLIQLALTEIRGHEVRGDNPARLIYCQLGLTDQSLTDSFKRARAHLADVGLLTWAPNTTGTVAYIRLTEAGVLSEADLAQVRTEQAKLIRFVREGFSEPRPLVITRSDAYRGLVLLALNDLPGRTLTNPGGNANRRLLDLINQDSGQTGISEFSALMIGMEERRIISRASGDQGYTQIHLVTPLEPHEVADLKEMTPRYREVIAAQKSLDVHRAEVQLYGRLLACVSRLQEAGAALGDVPVETPAELVSAEPAAPEPVITAPTVITDDEPTDDEETDDSDVEKLLLIIEGLEGRIGELTGQIQRSDTLTKELLKAGQTRMDRVRQLEADLAAAEAKLKRYESAAREAKPVIGRYADMLKNRLHLGDK
jgi:hypothetical protein